MYTSPPNTTPTRPRLLRLEYIIGSAGMIPVSRATFYAWIARGLMPRPRKLGRISVWYEDELVLALQRMMDEQLPGDDDAIRAQLHLHHAHSTQRRYAPAKDSPCLNLARTARRRRSSSCRSTCRHPTRHWPLPKSRSSGKADAACQLNGCPNALSNSTSSLFALRFNAPA